MPSIYFCGVLERYGFLQVSLTGVSSLKESAPPTGLRSLRLFFTTLRVSSYMQSQLLPPTQKLRVATTLFECRSDLLRNNCYSKVSPKRPLRLKASHYVVIIILVLNFLKKDFCKTKHKRRFLAKFWEIVAIEVLYVERFFIYLFLFIFNNLF